MASCSTKNPAGYQNLVVPPKIMIFVLIGIILYNHLNILESRLVLDLLQKVDTLYLEYGKNVPLKYKNHLPKVLW